jgi:hypothetical protein
LLISCSSQFVLLFHSPFSYLAPYILLNIFLSKTSTACSSFFVTVHASAPYDTIGLMADITSQNTDASSWINLYISHNWPNRTFPQSNHRNSMTYWVFTALKIHTVAIWVMPVYSLVR